MTLCVLFLQIVSVGKHVKGYHYIMANLVSEIVLSSLFSSSLPFPIFPQLLLFLPPCVALLIFFLFKTSSLIHIPCCSTSDKTEQARIGSGGQEGGTSVYRISLITGQLEYFPSSLHLTFVHRNRVLRTSIWSVSCMAGQT